MVRGEVTWRAVRLRYTSSSMTTKRAALGSEKTSAAVAPISRGPNMPWKASL